MDGSQKREFEPNSLRVLVDFGQVVAMQQI